MKRFFSGLGKGLLFAAIYIGLQFGVSIVAMIVITAVCAAGYGAQQLDMLALAAESQRVMLENSNLITIVSNVLTLVAVFVIFRIGKRRFFEEIRLFKTSWKALLPVPIAAAAMTLVVTSAMELLPIPESAIQNYAEMSQSLSLGNPVIAFLGVVIVAPIVEEVVFRGLVYSNFKRGMPMVIALLLECAIFGVLHGAAVWMAYAFLLGVMMTLVFEAYGTLLASIVFHLTFNLFGTYVTPYLSFSSPVYPLAAGLVIAAACCVFMVRWRNRRRVIDSE